jgi:hypothetical protein
MEPLRAQLLVQITAAAAAVARAWVTPYHHVSVQWCGKHYIAGSLEIPLVWLGS